MAQIRLSSRRLTLAWLPLWPGPAWGWRGYPEQVTGGCVLLDFGIAFEALHTHDSKTQSKLLLQSKSDCLTEVADGQKGLILVMVADHHGKGGLGSLHGG